LLVSWPQDRTRHRQRHQLRSRPGRQHWPAFAAGSGGAGHRIEHNTGQGADRNHDQGDGTGPLLLVELVEMATGSNTAPAKMPATIKPKATAPSRRRWWN
jgi:hypothetical protein